MNNRLKFRAWLKAESRMVYQGVEESFKSFVDKFGDHELMQYANLHDIHGRAIYEGDVVRIIESGPAKSNDLTEIVAWETSELHNGWTIIPSDSHQILGSLLENPDLIQNLYIQKISNLHTKLNAYDTKIFGLTEQNNILEETVTRLEEELFKQSCELNKDDDCYSIKKVSAEENVMKLENGYESKDAIMSLLRNMDALKTENSNLKITIAKLQY